MGDVAKTLGAHLLMAFVILACVIGIPLAVVIAAIAN